MELGTFGAILTFALEFEGNITGFYTAAAENVGDEAQAAVLSDLTRAGEKRGKLLERTRRENVAEMILEPITDFRSEDYPCDTAVPAGASSGDLVRRALALEETAVAYYTAASEKVSVPEVARILKKVAAQHARQRETLETLDR
jgi:rubrerythrin